MKKNCWEFDTFQHMIWNDDITRCYLDRGFKGTIVNQNYNFIMVGQWNIRLTS